MRPTLVFVLGLIASLFTAAIVYRAVQPPPKQLPAPSARVNPVVVAATDLPMGSPLEQKHLKAIEWPAGAMPANAYGTPETLIGRVTTSRLVANEPITNDKLAPVGTHGLLPLVIEPGMRAVTVRVNEVSAVGGFITPGCRVDVLVTASVTAPVDIGDATGPQTDGTPVPQRRTRTLLQNMTVLALGQVLETKDPNPPANLTTATLLAKPDEAELLTLAAAHGSLQLVLRGFSDNGPVNSEGKSSEDLFSAATRAAMARPPKDQVELIRGPERVVLSF